MQNKLKYFYSQDFNKLSTTNKTQELEKYIK